MAMSKPDITGGGKLHYCTERGKEEKFSAASSRVRRRNRSCVCFQRPVDETGEARKVAVSTFKLLLHALLLWVSKHWRNGGGSKRDF